MKVQHIAEQLRGQVMALSDQLESPPETLDDADHTCLLRLMAELDRLADKIEQVAGAQAATG